MTWIKTIPFAEAEGKLKLIYSRVSGPDGNVDNILTAHSLRPHSLEGHMALYKGVLHHARNKLPKWYLEVLGVYVSALNGCAYCVNHHFHGLKRLLKDDARSDKVFAALTGDKPEDVFSGRELAALQYAKKLTRTSADMAESDIAALRDAGIPDGEILEINQVAAYFAYANRTVLGLGVNTDGDILGLSPGDSDDPDNWSHG